MSTMPLDLTPKHEQGNPQGMDAHAPSSLEKMDSSTTNETDSSPAPSDEFSLRPQTKFIQQGLEGTIAHATGRKRHLSTSEEATHQFLQHQKSTEKQWSHLSHILAAPAINAMQPHTADAKKRQVELPTAVQAEIYAAAKKHCNKQFTLKSREMTAGSSAHQFELPPAHSMFKHQHWEVAEMQQLKRELNRVKGEVARGESSRWSDHTSRVNPARGVFNAVKNRAGPEFISQAFLKFYEVLHRYDVVPPSTASSSGGFTSVHLCEAPGGFIVALNHYLRLHRPHLKEWRWLANTLHPHYEGSPAAECIADDRVILRSISQWVFGHDGTGNIMRRSCLAALQERCERREAAGGGCGGVQLVTADGSIDCQSNPGEQEATTARLHYCEVVAGIELLSRGGSLVVKMFTFFEDQSICLLYLLCCLFQEVHLYKPITSKLGNSEVYVVCLVFCGREKELSVDDFAGSGADGAADVSSSADGAPTVAGGGLKVEYLKKLLEEYQPVEEENGAVATNDCSSSSKPMFSRSDLPAWFVSTLTECAGYFKTHQAEAIERNVRLYSSDGGEDRVQDASCCRLQELVVDTYLAKNPISPIDESDRLFSIDDPIVWDKNIHPASFQNKKWTGTFARLNQEEKYTHLQNSLRSLNRHYALQKSDNLMCYSGKEITLYKLEITRGVPFKVIGTSRFCFDTVLYLYSEYVRLKQKLTQTQSAPETNDASNEVIFIRADEYSSASYPEYDGDTLELIKYFRENFSHSHLLVESYPSHCSAPSSSCNLLERLYTLLKDSSLAQGCSINVVNFHLLSRLQNSLFVALSSCFDKVTLYEDDVFPRNRGLPCHPILELSGLDAAKAQHVVKKLQGVGWAPGAHSTGVMEVLDASVLINCVSHSLVCRYNALLLLVWSTMVERCVKQLRDKCISNKCS